MSSVNDPTNNIAIITNGKPRELLYPWDLTHKEKKELDYVDWDEHTGNDFFRYRGEIYDVREFGTASYYLRGLGWEFQQSDTFFSGILFSWVEGSDWEEIIAGRYFN